MELPTIAQVRQQVELVEQTCMALLEERQVQLDTAVVELVVERSGHIIVFH